MKESVATAVRELELGLPGVEVMTLEDDSGGAHVLLSNVDFGPAFTPRRSWIGFHVTWNPDADVYPHFIDPATKYVGEAEAPVKHPEGDLPVALTRDMNLPGFDRPAIQISRRSPRRDAETDSPLHKLLRVLEFLRTR